MQNADSIHMKYGPRVHFDNEVISFVALYPQWIADSSYGRCHPIPSKRHPFPLVPSPFASTEAPGGRGCDDLNRIRSSEGKKATGSESREVASSARSFSTEHPLDPFPLTQEVGVGSPRTFVSSDRGSGASGKRPAHLGRWRVLDRSTAWS